MEHPYEKALQVPAEDLDLSFSVLRACPWAEFWLNPRMLRGSDFLMRWSQGVWSEKRLIEATNATSFFRAVAYGPSGVAPEEPRAVELYFERLEAAGVAGQKRPDLLIHLAENADEVAHLMADIGGETELPFTPESDPRVQRLLDLSVAAIECENSLWHAARMPGWGKPLNEKRLAQGLPGLPKSTVLPTIILKDEDIGRLDAWQAHHRLPLHVWHVFFDRAFGISFDDAKTLVQEQRILPTIQTFQAPGGATTKKAIYKIYYHYAYALGMAVEEPALKAEAIVDKNGHVLPYVAFDGGRLHIEDQALTVLHQAAADRRR